MVRGCRHRGHLQSSDEWLEPVHATTGLGDAGDHVVTSNLGGHAKPDSAAREVLLDDGPHARDVLVADDQTHDLDARARICARSRP